MIDLLKNKTDVLLPYYNVTDATSAIRVLLVMLFLLFYKDYTFVCSSFFLQHIHTWTTAGLTAFGLHHFPPLTPPFPPLPVLDL